MKNNFNKAFTLVELIVVITILAVLATVAFISFQGYTSSSRDSVRLADLKNIEKQLNIHFTQNNIYPDPSSPVSIPTWWTQGELWKSVTNQIWVSEVQDPLTKNYYFYRISQNKRKYQLMWFLENSDSITFSPLRSTFAENDIPYSKGDKLWIVLNSDGKTLPTTIDLSTGTYNVIFWNHQNEQLINISWEDNFVALKASDTYSFDTSLVWYWDMETFTASWYLADLSGNGHYGIINDDDTSGFANSSTGWYMTFDWVDDAIGLNMFYESWDISQLTVCAMARSIKTDPQVLASFDRTNNWRLSFSYEYVSYRGVGFGTGHEDNDIDDMSTPETYYDWGWHYICGWFDKDASPNKSIYVDGEVQISATVKQWLKLSNTFEWFTTRYGYIWVGSEAWALNGLQWPLNFFQWDIKEVRIYDRALSSAEIQNLYLQAQ